MFLLPLEKKTIFFAFVGKEDNVFSCRRTMFFAFIGERRQSFLLLFDYSDYLSLSLNIYSLSFTCKAVANLANIVVGMKVLNYHSKKALSSLLILVPEIQYPK
jgi:hypothetical protein